MMNRNNTPTSSRPTAGRAYDNVKNNIRVVDFYQTELPGVVFKKHGWNDGGLCPFHADRSSGSFRVNRETGSFLCFACGIKGGDIIAFLEKRYGLSFKQAVEKLARDWGLS